MWRDNLWQRVLQHAASKRLTGASRVEQAANSGRLLDSGMLSTLSRPPFASPPGRKAGPVHDDDLVTVY